MRINLKKTGVVLLSIIVLSSCVNLKYVNDFSSTSLQGVQSFEELNYSFRQSCIDKCISEKINSLEFDDEEECNCKLENVADSITFKIYNSIYGYFESLTNLSNNKLTSYRTEDLELALTEGKFGPITINKEQVVSYSKISKILIRAFTDTYRKKNIKEYVKEANEPVKVLIYSLDFNISANLNGKLNVKKERLKADYFDLLQDDSLSTVEKRNSLKDYYAEIDEIENYQKKFSTYSKILKKISEGHQQLYDNIDKLTANDIKQALYQSASEIQTVILEFNKIT